MPDLSGKCVVLGVTGGIAAYKAAEIVSRLGKMGAKVRVVMTQNATRFITPITLQTLSGQKVHVDTFDESWEIGHIALAKEAHMNIFRCWGGSGINKRAFYDLCDRAGLLLWVEFPLACNDYAGTPHYLKILEPASCAGCAAIPRWRCGAAATSCSTAGRA